MKHKLVFLLIFLLCIVVLLYAVFFVQKEKKNESVEKMNSKNEETVVGELNDKQGFIQGEIVEIGGDIIKVRVMLVSGGLFSDGFGETIDAKISEKTKIFGISEQKKDSDQAIIDESGKKEGEILVFKDLKVGDFVRVTFSESESSVEEIIANEVFLMPKETNNNSSPMADNN